MKTWEITYKLITPLIEERWRSFVWNNEHPDENTLRLMWCNLKDVSFDNINVQDITDVRPQYPMVDCVLEVIR